MARASAEIARSWLPYLLTRLTAEFEVQREILAYLARHSDAGDTLEGVAQWWLLERNILYQVELVERALAGLVKQGWVLEHTMPDDRTLFRIRESRKEEIGTFLRQHLPGGMSASKDRDGR